MLWGKRYSSGSQPTVSVFLPACCFATPAILCSLFLSEWQRLSDREETFCYCKTGRLLYKRTDFFTCTLITRKAQSINGTNNSFCFACRNWKVSDAELWMLCPFFFFLSIYFLSFYVTVWGRSAIKSWAESAEMRFAPGIRRVLTVPKMRTDCRIREAKSRNVLSVSAKCHVCKMTVIVSWAIWTLKGTSQSELKTSGLVWGPRCVAGQSGITDALSGLCRDGAQRAAKGLFLI